MIVNEKNRRRVKFCKELGQGARAKERQWILKLAPNISENFHNTCPAADYKM